MKRIINLTAAILLTTLFVQAQGIQFGLRAGVNFQNLNGTDQFDNDLKNDILTAFNAGLTVEIPLVPEFSFQSGLLYSIKGAKSTEKDLLGNTTNITTKISYLELPLNFLFKPLLGNGHLLLGVGPYVALGIGGTIKREGEGFSNTEDIEFKNTVTSSDPLNVIYVKSLDFGASLLAGYEFSNNLSFQLNAQLGLSDINPEIEYNTNDKTSVKNTGFGFTLGYGF